MNHASSVSPAYWSCLPPMVQLASTSSSQFPANYLHWIYLPLQLPACSPYCFSSLPSQQPVPAPKTSHSQHVLSLLWSLFNLQCPSLDRDHISPVLAFLHWLPVKFRIEFKILLPTYKALNDQAPSYLKELVVHFFSKQSTSLSDCMQVYLWFLEFLKVEMGGRAFSYQARKQTPSLPLRLSWKLSFLPKLIVKG